MPTLLVIDDEYSIRYAFRRAFDDARVSVRTVGSAAEGYDEFLEQPPDAVVIDVKLPDESGLSLLSRLRQLGYDVPAIVITGCPSSEVTDLAHNLAAVDCLCKPLNVGQIRSLIYDVFEERSSGDPPSAGAETTPDDSGNRHSSVGGENNPADTNLG